jgi:hypothetical protein
MTKRSELLSKIGAEEDVLERLGELEKQPGWKLFVDTLRSALLGRRQTIFSHQASSLDDLVQLVKLQGECAGLELANALVETLKMNAQVNLEALKSELSSVEERDG